MDRAQRFRRPTATAGMDGRADAVRGEGGPAQATPVQVVRAATTYDAREDQRAWGGVPIGNERGGGLPLDGERGGNVAVHRGDGGVLPVHGLGERATCATDLAASLQTVSKRVTVTVTEVVRREVHPHKDLPREVHPREVVLRGVHPREVHPCDVHPCEVVPAREVHPRKDLPREVHARQVVPQEAHPREDMEYGLDREGDREGDREEDHVGDRNKDREEDREEDRK